MARLPNKVNYSEVWLTILSNSLAFRTVKLFDNETKLKKINPINSILLDQLQTKLLFPTHEVIGKCLLKSQ